MKKSLWKVVLGVCFLSLFALSLNVSAEETSADAAVVKKIDGNIDLNGYFDTRDFNVLTINALANLPHRFQYFSFVNYFNAAGTSDNFDLTNYYTEQNLRWAISEKLPFDASFQYVGQTGAGNDLVNLGFRWRVSNTPWLDRVFKKLNTFYSITFHALQTNFKSDINSFTIEHFYSTRVFPSFFKDRVYLSGFMDHNLKFASSFGDNHNIFVMEHQLGVRVISQLHAVAEFRRNEYSPTKKNGVGLGLEYIIKF